MRSVLVTGGTGSFGQAFVRRALELGAERVVVFSRDEAKQDAMRWAFKDDSRLRWAIGDVRDVERLKTAMTKKAKKKTKPVDVVIHAAAMKQVEACQYNPFEAKKTNVDGAENVINAALAVGVPKVMALSTDKAVDAVNTYGKTKSLAEDMFVDANNYSGADGTRFACVRYGNVLSSRGSVLPVWIAASERGEPLRITDPSMTRFVITLPQAVDFVLGALADMKGGEVFVPRLPALDLVTMAQAVTWPRPPELDCVGVRPGEKKHELLISTNEAHRTRDEGDRFVVYRWLGKGGGEGEFSSASAEQLGVDAFRRLAGLGGVEEVAA